MPFLAATRAERWLAAIRIRRRKPVKPARLAGWRHSLDKWLLPLIGETRLADVGNATLKTVIEKMTASGLAAKSILSHSRLVKVVVASAVNTEGEELYPRKWNHEFCEMPIIDDTTSSHRDAGRSRINNRGDNPALQSSCGAPRRYRTPHW